MTQSQVAAYMADKLGLTKKQGKQVLEEINGLVVRELKKEGSLRLAGLGIFRKRTVIHRSRQRRRDAGPWPMGWKDRAARREAERAAFVVAGPTVTGEPVSGGGMTVSVSVTFPCPGAVGGLGQVVEQSPTASSMMSTV